MAAVEKVGKARIYVDGGDARGVMFDNVEIHSSGVVRASDRRLWEQEELGSAEGETKAVYYAPHAWHKIEPETPRNCTLWVSDVEFQAESDWQWVASCLAFDDIETRALRYLEDRYPGFDGLTVLGKAFDRGAHLGLDEGDRRVRFAWAHMLDA